MSIQLGASGSPGATIFRTPTLAEVAPNAAVVHTPEDPKRSLALTVTDLSCEIRHRLEVKGYCWE